MGEEGVVLEEDAHVPPIGRNAAHILAVHQDGAGKGLGKAGDHPQRGGFSAAAAAKQGDHLALGHRQVHVVNGGKIAEFFCQML